MRLTWIPIIFLAALVTACGNDYTPKPRGYFRIDFPDHSYRRFDTTFPYTFEYPGYAMVVPDPTKLSEPYWINILYQPFNAQLHVSYKRISGGLEGYLEDARALVNKHIPKATAITQQEYINDSAKVYGLVFEIRGSDAASAYQFYLTDSLSNFVRGALYFNLVPNNDSLAPVISFLKTDIQHMISTFRWKKI